MFVSAANSTHTVRWVNALAERGHEVYLVSNRGHEPKEDALNSRVKLYLMKHSGGKGYYLNAGELRKIAKRIIRMSLTYIMQAVMGHWRGKHDYLNIFFQYGEVSI